MKVGSIVECVDNNNCEQTPPELNKPYTVAEIHGDNHRLKNGNRVYGIGIKLEELRNMATYTDGSEKFYKANRFRELLPPIANIEETIKEQTLEIELV